MRKQHSFIFRMEASFLSPGFVLQKCKRVSIPPSRANNWQQKSSNRAPCPRMSPESPPGMAADKCTRPENEDPFKIQKIVLKSLEKGSNMILGRSRNKEQQYLRFSMHLTRVFVLYITLPKVQNEDLVKIVLKSHQNGSNMIIDQSRNKEQQDMRLSTNLTRVFILYITLPKVQNEDPFKILFKYKLK